MFQIKIFVPNKMFLPKESTCSKWKYLFQTDLFFPKGYIFATIISCAELFHLHILLTSGLHWNGNIFSKWKTNLHLPHRLAQSPLGVTKPENGILNIKNFYILENQSFLIWSCSIFLSLSLALILMRTMTSLMTLLQMLLNSSPSL